MWICQTQIQNNSRNFKQNHQSQSFKLIPNSSPINPNPSQPQLANTILNLDPPQSSVRGHKPQRKPNPFDPHPLDTYLLVLSSTSMDPASNYRHLVQQQHRAISSLNMDVKYRDQIDFDLKLLEPKCCFLLKIIIIICKEKKKYTNMKWRGQMGSFPFLGGFVFSPNLR